jgi:hypothetical protein
VGVGLLSKKESIKVYKKQTHYNQWEFVFDPNQTALEATAGAGTNLNANGTNGTTGNGFGSSTGNGFGSTSGNGFGSTGSNTGFGSGSGSGFGSGGSGFGNSPSAPISPTSPVNTSPQ